MMDTIFRLICLKSLAAAHNPQQYLGFKFVCSQNIYLIYGLPFKKRAIHPADIACGSWSAVAEPRKHSKFHINGIFTNEFMTIHDSVCNAFKI